MKSAPCDDRDPVEVLAEEFLEQQRNGRNPTIAEFAARYPDLALEIRELFPAIIAMEQLKSHCDNPSGKHASLGAAQIERLGEFRLLGEIGRGGMGIVYEALHESLGRHVAVKVLPKQSAKQCRAFQREARTAARLHHTNIVPLFGVGEQDGYHYLVMQLIRGVDLEAVLAALRTLRETGVCSQVAVNSAKSEYSGDAIQLARVLTSESCDAMGETSTVFAAPTQAIDFSERPFAAERPAPGPKSLSRLTRPYWTQTRNTLFSTSEATSGNYAFGPQYWRRVAIIGRQSAEALHYAHRQHTQHRDIKPANLILDAQGVVWITDFGLAKAVDDTHGSQWGNLAGTLRYMAPEQFSDQCDHRSDIYSLGLTLYELLTLQPAFVDSSRSNLIRRITQESPRPPSSICPGIPADLDAIVMKAIARDPAHRYQSAGDLVHDLQRFLEDRPVSAREVPFPERFRKWTRRNRPVAALSAAAGVLLLTTAVFAAAQYVQRTNAWARESKLRTQAESQRMRAEANLALAAEAFDDVFVRVTGTPLSGSLDVAMEQTPTSPMIRPVVGESEAAILKGLLAFYEQFAAKNEGDLRWQRETARAFRRSGEIQFRLGNSQEADASFRRALTIYQQLAQSEPKRSEYIAGIAATRNQLADVAAETGRPDIALHESRRAWQELLQQPPDVISSPACQIELANAYNRYAISSPQFPFGSRPGSTTKSRPVSSREYLLRSIEIVKNLLNDNPGQIEYSITMAESYRYLWGVESLNKRFPEAQQAREQAIQMLEALANSYPADPECRFMLAEVYLLPIRYGFGEITDPDAVRHTDRAIEVASELVNRFPQMPNHQVILAQALWASARARQQAGDMAVAKVNLQQAITLQKSIIEQFPSRSRHRVDLVRFLEDRTKQIRTEGTPQELLATMEERIAAMERVPVSYRHLHITSRSRAKAYAEYAEVLHDQGQSERALIAESKSQEWTKEAARRYNRFPFKPPPSKSESTTGETPKPQAGTSAAQFRQSVSGFGASHRCLHFAFC